MAGGVLEDQELTAVLGVGSGRPGAARWRRIGGNGRRPERKETASISSFRASRLDSLHLEEEETTTKTMEAPIGLGAAGGDGDGESQAAVGFPRREEQGGEARGK